MTAPITSPTAGSMPGNGGQGAAGMVMETLLPLAVTLDTDGGGCVAGVTHDGRWLRPGPITAAHVAAAQAPYRFYRPVSLGLVPSTEPDRRPEDRVVVVQPVLTGVELTGSPLEEQLCAVAAGSVTDAFAGDASAGLVKADPQQAYHRRSTGGRSYLRLRFTDRAGTAYDWIVRDVRLLRGPLAEVPPADLTARLRDAALYLSIGLTKPNGRFPGQFRGCHPLIVGVHGAGLHEPEGAR